MKFQLETDEIDGFVTKVTEAALVEALTRNSGKVVESLVSSVLNQKVEKYGSDTFLKVAIREAVKERAQVKVKEWLEANDSAIRDLVTTQVEQLLTPAFVTEQVMTTLRTMTGQVNFKKKARTDSVDLNDEEE